MHILWSLSHNGPQRFSVLRRQIEGISSRVLTERLRTLAEQGFIYRNYEPTIPPTVTYGITSRMKDIEKVLSELDRLAKSWQAAEKANSHSSGETSSASPVQAEPSIT
jgi:DNA-binding HxlR family transcriptional regulator